MQVRDVNNEPLTEPEPATEKSLSDAFSKLKKGEHIDLFDKSQSPERLKEYQATRKKKNKLKKQSQRRNR